MMGKVTTEEEVLYMIKEADCNDELIDLQAFKRIICKHKNRSKVDDEVSDTLLAYIAMGGDEDGGGYINVQKMIHIIKEEFEMTIDIRTSYVNKNVLRNENRYSCKWPK